MAHNPAEDANRELRNEDVDCAQENNVDVDSKAVSEGSDLSPLEEFAAQASEILEGRQVDMTDSSAYRIEAGQVKMNGSSAQQIQASAVNIDESFAGVVKTNVADARESLIGVVLTDEAKLEDVSSSVLVGRNIEAKNVRTTLLFGRQINGRVTTLLTPRTAFAAGVGIYFAWLVIHKIFLRLPLISRLTRKKS